MYKEMCSVLFLKTFSTCRLESYFSNKQSSPGDVSNRVDLSLNDENSTFVQLQGNKQINLNISKGSDSTNIFQIANAGELIY